MRLDSPDYSCVCLGSPSLPGSTWILIGQAFSMSQIFPKTCQDALWIRLPAPFVLQILTHAHAYTKEGTLIPNSTCASPNRIQIRIQPPRHSIFHEHPFLPSPLQENLFQIPFCESSLRAHVWTNSAFIIPSAGQVVNKAERSRLVLYVCQSRERSTLRKSSRAGICP